MLHHKLFIKLESENLFKPLLFTLTWTPTTGKNLTFLTFFMLNPMVAQVEVVTASFYLMCSIYTQGSSCIFV